MTNTADPWSVPITVVQIPDTGLHRDFEADPAVRGAMAEVGGLREVLSASASLDVMPKSGGRVHVTGHVRARIGQTCVVTLDPIENEIDEPIDLIFAPPEQIPELSDLVDEAAESDVEIPDPPEPIVNGVIDLGRLATDALFLAVDPYPRRPDAVFEPPVEAADPDDHPFAALKALRPDAKSSAAKKPPASPRVAKGSKGGWRCSCSTCNATTLVPGSWIRISFSCIELTGVIHIYRICPAAAWPSKGSGQEVVSGRGNAIVAARPGCSVALRRSPLSVAISVRGSSASSPQEIRFPGRSCLKRFESRLTPWVAMSAHRSSFPAPRFR